MVRGKHRREKDGRPVLNRWLQLLRRADEQPGHYERLRLLICTVAEVVRLLRG